MSLYLVTGGAGFIGSHLVEELLRRGENVRILDNFATGSRENIEDAVRESRASRRPEVVEADIRDQAAVRLAMRGAEYVLHQAALPSVARSVADPSATNEVNVTGTMNVLLAARDEKVKRFVYASSSSIYGDTIALPKDETMPPEPRSPYAVSKLAGERYSLAFHGVFGLPVVCLRYFNVFGPRQDPKSQYSAVIPKFIVAMLRNERPIIHGDGQQSRDFTFVANVVQANLLACERKGACGHVINIACGERHTLLDLCNELRALTGVQVEPTFAEFRPGDVAHSMAAIQVAKEFLGYQPTVMWTQGLAATVDWYKNRPVAEVAGHQVSL